ncbi:MULTISPECIES: alpha/beta hydrolase family protein [Pacificimonas]|nr:MULTISPECIES: S9 family peptidase [Pacificimonas]MBZ6378943.1 S9 family peptidase [Pacificimonas aurantium]
MTRFTRWCAGGLAALFSALTPALAADQPEDINARFGIMPSATGMRLSPDGTHVSFIDHSRGYEGLKIANVETGEIIPLIRSDGEVRMTSCLWLNNDRLGCQMLGSSNVDGKLVGYQRFLAIDKNGENTRQLGQRATARHVGLNQFGGQLIDILPDDPEHILMSLEQLRTSRTGSQIGSEEEGFTVQRVDVDNNRMAKVVGPIDRAAFFATDTKGEVRIFGEYSGHSDQRYGPVMELHVREPGGHGWTRLAETSLSDYAALEFEGFSSDGDEVYVRIPYEGHLALARLPIDGSRAPEIVWSNPNYDAGGLVTFGPNKRPVGVSWADEGNHIEFFDQELAQLQNSLIAALGGDMEVSLIDESWDGQRILLVASSDTKPGTYYLFDRSAGELRPLMDIRPWLKNVALGSRQPISYPAADGAEIPAYLTLPPGKTMEAGPMPLLVMPHGGPSARDYWGFDWLAQTFAAQGFAVIQPNYRGSTGFGAQWSGRNAYQDWEIAISDITDAARWAIGEGLTTQDRTGILGWSYGGYAALQSAAIDPDLFQAVVAIAPVTDLQQLKDDMIGFMQYDLRAMSIGTGPHLVEGSPRRQAEHIEAPVLLFHGTKDTNVLVSHSRRMADRLEKLGKPVDYVEFDDLDHQLPQSEARIEMLEKSASFLKRELGAP